MRPALVLAAVLLLVLLTSSPLPSRAAPDPAIDWAKARQLHERDLRGEPLNADDKAYLDRARALVRAGRGPGAANPATRPAGAAPGRANTATAPAKPTGLIPLTELGDQTYKGQIGGLYGDGKNQPPPAHQQAAAAATALVQPRDAQGHPAPDGKIVLLSIGMSNTTQEFSRFKELADQDVQKSPKLIIVDGAQGGQDAQRWARPDPNAGPGQGPWPTVTTRLGVARVTDAQVQVIWLKQASIQPARYGEFPRHTDQLAGHIQTILQQARQRFPNLRLAYLSSRIYAGYAVTALNPEPYAYESAFAVRSLILRQIQGDPALDPGPPDPARGPVKAPLLLWGPYLWADGPTPRGADGLTYLPQDLGADGTHPSQSGRQKVAEQLLHFFQTDALAKTWFVKK